MANRAVKHLLQNMYSIKTLLRRQESPQRFVYGVVSLVHLRRSKADKVEADVKKELKDYTQTSVRAKVEKTIGNDSEGSKYSSDDEDLSDSKWRLEPIWLTKAIQPALQLVRWARQTGNETGKKTPSTSHSLTEIIAHIQRNKIGIQDWSLSDLTIGLYLIYLRQASTNPFEDVKGVQIFSDEIVEDLIYHLELAKGCYKDTAASLARHSMIRESNVMKFVRDSSIMRPGYYIGIDPRKRLVLLGVRGTHTVYDLITDIATSSDKEVTFDGYSTHFGTAEAARWFLNHELGTIRKCLEKYQGYRLRLVGHSLGGAIASLLAVELRKKSVKELGFSPDIVSAIGYATPPCVSRILAESCSDYVTTVVMQDDIVPRLSVASLTRLRNEILETDWKSVVEKEDWRSVVDLVTNVKQVVSSVQDVARKIAEYAKFRSKKDSSDGPTSIEEESRVGPTRENGDTSIKGGAVAEELFVPGTVYYLKRNVDNQTGRSLVEYFSLWKRHPDEHFQRILLSSNLISDHKCESHYYALRDVLKGFPVSKNDGIFP